ncbi:hypothetical protein TrCOL_g7453 [Triparma columacea]|nr:hypothetical protein TrCOL_g7453 [Triparma columacea]
MNEKTLIDAALANGGYETPELNDKLYLHFKGYKRIENLEAYTGLASIWLDSNGFDKIENLGHLVKLRSLFLQKNLIPKIENVGMLSSLVHLDLSENRIRKVEGLGTLKNLQTLNLSKNFLETTESVLHLADCAAITNVDLSTNTLKEESIITDALGKMPSLVACNMDGNPMVREVGNFRKKMINAVKKLRYMDRPVFENERAGAEAWAEGGYELERKVKQEWAQKKRDSEKQSLQDFRDWQNELRKQKAEELKNGPSKETLEKRAKHQAFMQEKRAAAKIEAEEEKRLFSDPEAARKAGVNFWSTSEEKDIFGNVRSSASKPIEFVEEVKGEGEEKGEGEGGVESKGEGGSKGGEIFNFQGSAPGTGEGKGPMDFKKKDAGLPVPPENERFGEKKEEEEEEKDAEVVPPPAPGGGESGYGSDEERQRRVDESMMMWKKQQEAKKERKSRTSRGAVGGEENREAAEEAKVTIKGVTNGFDALVKRGEGERDTESKEGEEKDKDKEKDGFYWSEGMDVCLAKHVHKNMFDFELVSKAIMAELEGQTTILGNTTIDELTEDRCRERWCELDVDDTAEPAAIGLRSNIHIGEGGKQMSFAELQRQVNGMESGLLKRPTELPGVGVGGDGEGDDDDDDDDEDVGVVDIRALRKKMTNFETLD